MCKTPYISVVNEKRSNLWIASTCNLLLQISKSKNPTMSDLEKSFRELSKTENVFMFVPNLIGYGRILLALLSFWFMPTNYVAAAWCYILSGYRNFHI